MKKHTKKTIEELVKSHEELIDSPKLIKDYKEMLEFFEAERLRIKKEVHNLKRKDKITDILNEDGDSDKL